VDEKDIYRIMMWASVALAVISGLGAVLLLVLTVSDGLRLIFPTLLLAAITVASGGAVVYFGQRMTGYSKVFSNAIEQEVLSRKQRRDLRQARGDLVMQRALNEVENERDNIIHRQIEASHDPDKPPHQTRFSDGQIVDDTGPRRVRQRGDWGR
jgi:hypothetical protein